MDTMRLEFPRAHPAFAGHFPGAPILPGALLLDEAVRVLATKIDRAQAECEIAAAKFLSVVRPGEALTLEHEHCNDGSVRFLIRTVDRTVATGRISWAPAAQPAHHEV